MNQWDTSITVIGGVFLTYAVLPALFLQGVRCV